MKEKIEALIKNYQSQAPETEWQDGFREGALRALEEVLKCLLDNE